MGVPISSFLVLEATSRRAISPTGGDERMASRLWRGIDKDQAQRRADEERRLAAQAADWLKLRSSFVERLSELRAPQTINFRDYRLRECFSPQVHAWWPAERAEEIEARLLAADARGDVRLGHLHGGTPESNPALDTLRMLDRAEKAGDEAKRAMLVLALLEYRCIDNHPAIPSDLRWRANAACRSVHPLLRELNWNHGSKRLLPNFIAWCDPPTDLRELGRQLAEDGAGLLINWVAVRIERDPSDLVQKSEPA